MSGRLSDRVVDPDANHLFRGTKSADNAAEASRPQASPTRIGRRQLDRMHGGLSDRDLAVLHSVAACHYLTTTQLERLWFHGTGMTPLAAARGSRRTLRRLHQLGLLEHLERRVGGVRAGSASYVWTLAGLGARLLGQARRRQHREPGPRHLDHVLAVADLVVRLHEAARRDQLEVIGIETEPTCWRPVVTAHGGREWLKPDLRVTIAVGEHELHWWVEVDRATEHRPTLQRKAEAYVRAWREGGEQQRAGVAPRILWVTPDHVRRQVVEAAVNSVDTPVGMFVASTDEKAVVALRSVSS